MPLQTVELSHSETGIRALDIVPSGLDLLQLLRQVSAPHRPEPNYCHCSVFIQHKTFCHASEVASQGMFQYSLLSLI